MASELNSCPFCGGEFILKELRGSEGVAVHHQLGIECHVLTPGDFILWRQTAAEAIAACNRREGVEPLRVRRWRSRVMLREALADLRDVCREYGLEPTFDSTRTLLAKMEAEDASR